MSEEDPLLVEHEELKRRITELKREHRRLQADPHDLVGHREHSAKLHQLTLELEAHGVKLKERYSSRE